MASKCHGKPKCRLYNGAGFLSCDLCGYQEDHDYIYSDATKVPKPQRTEGAA